MNYKVFSIHDNRTNEWAPPFFQSSNVHAIRSFTQAVRNPDPNNMLSNYPNDFDLYFIGTWDSESGILTTAIHEKVANAQAVLPKENTGNGQ